GIIMNGIIQQSREDLTIQRVLDASPLLEELTDLNIDRSQSRNQLVISATVRSPEPLSQDAVNDLAQALEEELQRPLILSVIPLPIITSE
ncbi:MAG: hypothetical protein HQ574_01895, partial [Chloroflexi bacterium]|nr:hypothetical protein [Chloroflexota bacterium]